jgi:small subunit ribosomal protein S11
MILSSILKKQKRQYDTLELIRIYINELYKLLNLLIYLKSPKSLAKFIANSTSEKLSTRFSYNNTITNVLTTLKTKVKENVISYIININLSPTNTIISVTDIKGNPKISLSAGLINLTKRQKKTQPMALINIFKILLLKARFLKDNPIALHFKNTKPYYESLIIRVLKDKLYIKSIQSYNLSPHNGCRPKKIKRIKRRTKRMVLR